MPTIDLHTSGPNLQGPRPGFFQIDPKQHGLDELSQSVLRLSSILGASARQAQEAALVQARQEAVHKSKLAINQYEEALATKQNELRTALTTVTVNEATGEPVPPPPPVTLAQDYLTYAGQLQQEMLEQLNDVPMARDLAQVGFVDVLGRETNKTFVKDMFQAQQNLNVSLNKDLISKIESKAVQADLGDVEKYMAQVQTLINQNIVNGKAEVGEGGKSRDRVFQQRLENLVLKDPLAFVNFDRGRGELNGEMGDPRYQQYLQTPSVRGHLRDQALRAMSEDRTVSEATRMEEQRKLEESYLQEENTWLGELSAGKRDPVLSLQQLNTPEAKARLGPKYGEVLTLARALSKTKQEGELDKPTYIRLLNDIEVGKVTSLTDITRFQDKLDHSALRELAGAYHARRSEQITHTQFEFSEGLDLIKASATKAGIMDSSPENAQRWAFLLEEYSTWYFSQKRKDPAKVVGVFEKAQEIAARGFLSPGSLDTPQTFQSAVKALRFKSVEEAKAYEKATGDKATVNLYLRQLNMLEKKLQSFDERRASKAAKPSQGQASQSEEKPSPGLLDRLKGMFVEPSVDDKRPKK